MQGFENSYQNIVPSEYLINYYPKKMSNSINITYPTIPNFVSMEDFENLDTDTLFFIFYYEKGTYEQYIASRIIKNRDWIYHKKFGTWFKKLDKDEKAKV